MLHDYEIRNWLTIYTLIRRHPVGSNWPFGYITDCQIHINLHCCPNVTATNITDDWIKFVGVMAWCPQATSHYLSHCWRRSMLPYCVTRQWCDALLRHQQKQSTLQWRDNERDGVKITIVTPPVTCRLPSKRANNAHMFQCDDVIMTTCTAAWKHASL